MPADRAALTERQQLYDQGLGDTEIAREQGAHKSTIREWRIRCNLPLNLNAEKTRTAAKYGKWFLLYEEGLSDRAISERMGGHEKTVTAWRIRYGLEANNPKHRKVSAAEHASRRLLYDLGFSDGAISKRLGLGGSRAVRKWRQRNGLCSSRDALFRTSDLAHRERDLSRRIERAVGHALPQDVAEVAREEIALALVTGDLGLSDIEREAQKYRNRALDQFGSKFGPRSLDAPIGNDEGFTLMDTLVDESSSRWLEEMGATVW